MSLKSERRTFSDRRKETARYPRGHEPLVMASMSHQGHEPLEDVRSENNKQFRLCSQYFSRKLPHILLPFFMWTQERIRLDIDWNHDSFRPTGIVYDPFDHLR